MTAVPSIDPAQLLGEQLERGDGVDEMPKRTAEPVELPDHEHVTRAQVLERRSQLRPVIARPRGDVGVDGVAAVAGKRVVLQRRVLLTRRHPRVADLVAHAQDRTENV